jgi:uncharacterized RDD family membrane protein YckC
LIAFAVGAAVYYAAKALSWPLEFAFLGALIYLLVCDAFPGGQSLGKRFTKSSVVHFETEAPCRGWQSVVRNLSILVLGFIDVLFIIGKQQRRLGDLMARTKVVKVDI